MRPNPSRRFKAKVGDIVENFLHDKYYLIIEAKMYEGEEYYNTICLNDGSNEMIGYWDYLFISSWRVVV